ncbi:MAG: NAD(P)/FAD-dependent oxidoreductase [Chloroflexota bacterium]
MSVAQVVVIGAGASGMMAAGRAAECGARVLLLEKMEHPGKKLLISGKTRCNLTNSQELDDFIGMYGPNGRFLYGAFHRFFHDDLLALMRRYGVTTAVERGGRVFPVSGDAGDIVQALQKYLADGRVEVRTGIRVTGIRTYRGCVSGVRTEQGNFPAKAVILATGGASYAATGSTGDGYRIAKALGHSIVPLRPALVPLAVEEAGRAASMQGVSLRNVRLTAYRCQAEEIDNFLTPTTDVGRGIGPKNPPKGVIESRLGEMMMTHFGIGGPITLQMSLAIVDALKEGPASVAIDLKPGLTEKQLHLRLQRDFTGHGKRSFRRLLEGLLPNKMIEPFIDMSGIPGDKPGHQVSATERERLVKLLKSLRFNIKSPLPMSVAMVTAGGVSLKEVDPRTMESRLVKGLYLCGEVLDIDGDTGGYNLQAAFSTGWVAGENAGGFVMCHLERK